MFASVIAFNSDDLIVTNKLIDKLNGALAVADISIDSLSIVSCDDEIGFRQIFNTTYTRAENLIILNENSADFDVTNVVADILNLSLIENDVATTSLNNYLSLKSIVYNQQVVYLPENAIVIPNEKGKFQAYYVCDNYKTLFVLPNTWRELESILTFYVVPYLTSKMQPTEQTCTYKLVGNNKLVNSILEFLDNYSDIEVKINSEYGDISACFKIKNLDEDSLNEFKSDFEMQFEEYIYADENISLEERLLYFVRLNDFTFSVAESFTGGRVASSIVKIPGASHNFIEGICAYSNSAKNIRLSVNNATLDTYGAVSSQTANEMVKGLLDYADFGISTTGIAGPKSDNTNKPVGLCYIGTGVKDYIITKELLLTGDREDITETGKNYALFYAIKHLQLLAIENNLVEF